MSKEQDWCQFPKCSNLSDLVYLEKGLCEKHWKQIAEMETDKAHKKLKIEVKNGTSKTDRKSRTKSEGDNVGGTDAKPIPEGGS